MGTGFAVVIAACAIFLILRREAVWYVPVAFLGTAAVLSALFPRLALAPIDSIKYELLSGSMLFCAAFLLNDPVTSPRTGVGRVCYAALGGLAVMLLRWLGPYEESAVFGVLLVNLLSPLLDWLVCFLRQKRLRKAEENLRRGAA